MGRIPKKLNDQLNRDPEYSTCMVTGDRSSREDPLERHHNLIYAGKQVQERFAILCIKRSIHDKARSEFTKARLDWIMLNRASTDELLRFSKAEDLFLKRAQLNKAFGVWKPVHMDRILY